MKNTIICTALASVMMTGSAYASQDQLRSPFLRLDAGITDISHDYIQGSYIANETRNGFSLKASKSLNRFMFVDASFEYVDPKDDYIVNDYGKSMDLGFGLNYPLPIPVDIMVADIYAKGFYHYLDTGNYVYQNMDSDDIDEINRSIISSSSYGAIGGLKSNFGSDDLYLNVYGGFEVTNFTGRVSFKDSKTETLVEIEDATLPIYGAELEYLFGKKTSLLFGVEHRLDENTLKTSLRYSF